MRTHEMAPLLLLLGSTAFLSCNDGRKETGDTVPACAEVIANAGPDQYVTLGSEVTLSGAASTTCSRGPTSFSWSFESIPVESAITDSAFTDNSTSTAVETQFSPDAVGTYVVDLRVTSSDIESATDVVVIEVSADDAPPVADCGDNITVELGDAAQLDGSASHDPDGDPITYSWALSSVPDESSLSSSDIFNTDSATPTVVPDVLGTYLVTLVVSDGHQWSDPDSCTITAVNGNSPPVADAGVGGTLPACSPNQLQLDGYGSYDPEGAPLTYQWSLNSAPSGSSCSNSSFDDRTSPTPIFTWDLPGDYIFQLEVYDGEIWSTPDTVNYTTTDRSENHLPVANAGDNQTITEISVCTGESYAALDCADCPATTLELDGSSSYDQDGDDIDFLWSEPTGDLSFSLPTSSFTLVTTPSMPGEWGVTTTTEWAVTLQVNDCEGTVSSSMTITYSCTGERG